MMPGSLFVMRSLVFVYVLYCLYVGWNAFNYYYDRRLLLDSVLLAVATVIVGFQIGIL
jgi:hypothetical protein